MRKIQQKRMLDSLSTLEEARIEVLRACGGAGGNADAILQTLVDCDAFADGIQSFIIECAGEGTETWGLIERFRDELIAVHKAISGGDENASAAVNGLRKFIAEIEDSVNSNSREFYSYTEFMVNNSLVTRTQIE